MQTRASSVCIFALISASSLALGIAEVRADIVSSSSDMFQIGLSYRDVLGNPTAFSGVSAGLSNMKLFSITAEVQPVGIAHVQGHLSGDVRVTALDGSSSSSAFSIAYDARNRNGGGGTRATMDIDLTNLDFSTLPPGILLRESPTLLSTGQTTITDQGDGTFRISSFFDIFTELSIDGGQSWLPATSSVHLDLLPAPSAAALMGLGLLGTVGRRRR